MPLSSPLMKDKGGVLVSLKRFLDGVRFSFISYAKALAIEANLDKIRFLGILQYLFFNITSSILSKIILFQG